VKIASQRLTPFSSPSLCALRNVCGESLSPLQSEAYKSLSPQWLASQVHINARRVVRLHFCRSLAASHKSPVELSNSFPCHTYRKSAKTLFFVARKSFCCHTYERPYLQALSLPHIQKTGGVPNPFHMQRRTSIPLSPKWSIIPAPDSPSRLRGRPV
jgi:hypothetical protein